MQFVAYERVCHVRDIQRPVAEPLHTGPGLLTHMIIGPEKS
jgi:hypothetical protein